jgi:hypothetical protein
MKPQAKAHAKQLFSSKNVVIPPSAYGILADSWEVKDQFCREKLAWLQNALLSLNVFDNALEIVAICKEMKRYKDELVMITQRIKKP